MSEEYKETLRPEVGNSVLVRFRFNDEEGNCVEEQQFFGRIEKISQEEVVLKSSEGGEVTLPPHFGSYEKADKNEYEMPSKGQTAHNPDFITEWTLRASSGS